MSSFLDLDHDRITTTLRAWAPSWIYRRVDASNLPVELGPAIRQLVNEYAAPYTTSRTYTGREQGVSGDEGPRHQLMLQDTEHCAWTELTIRLTPSVSTRGLVDNLWVSNYGAWSFQVGTHVYPSGVMYDWLICTLQQRYRNATVWLPRHRGDILITWMPRDGDPWHTLVRPQDDAWCTGNVVYETDESTPVAVKPVLRFPAIDEYGRADAPVPTLAQIESYIHRCQGNLPVPPPAAKRARIEVLE